MKTLLTTTAAIAIVINPVAAGSAESAKENSAGESRLERIEQSSRAMSADDNAGIGSIVVAQTNLLEDALGEPKEEDADNTSEQSDGDTDTEPAAESATTDEQPNDGELQKAEPGADEERLDSEKSVGENVDDGSVSGADTADETEDDVLTETETPAADGGEEPVEKDAPLADTPADEERAGDDKPGDEDEPGASDRSADEKATEEDTGAGTASREDAPEHGRVAKPAEASEPPQEAEPVAEQLKEATERPVVVLPEEVTESEKQALREAEARRREEARRNRDELLGAAAAGAAIGALVPLLGGRLVEDEGDRIIVERDGEYFVRRDENALLRERGVGSRFEELSDGRTRETMTRRNGVRVVTLRDAGGYILKRTKILPNGDEIVLIDTREDRRDRFVDFDEELPELEYDINDEDYIVSARGIHRERIREMFLAPPVESVEQDYSLREIRGSKRLRDKLRRLDLDTITFDTDSAAVRESQIPLLESAAEAIADVIDRDPAAVFLIEGHTDAIGSELYNLALSDRRAETVARIMIGYYGLPPENFVVEGYGEAFLKIETQEAERENRRATIRNITPLMMSNR